MKYNYIGTKTGRFKSKEPNFSNVPKDIRKIYKERSNYSGYDYYSNYELTLFESPLFKSHLWSSLYEETFLIADIMADLEKRISALEKQLNIKDVRITGKPIEIDPNKSFQVDISFNLADRPLGRFSSSDPRLQNIPIHTTEDKFESITCQCQMRVLMNNGCQCGGA